MSFVEIHFDGDFAYNHQVSLRNLSRTLESLQSAIDRAYLDNKHGNIWKHARLNGRDYELTNFLVQSPEEGGYILKFISTVEKHGRDIVDRIVSAVLPAYEQAMSDGEIEIDKYKTKIVDRKAQLLQDLSAVESYQGILRRQPNKDMLRQYGDKAIVKEIDKMLAPVKAERSGENSIELTFGDENNTRFLFDKTISERFHSVVSQKDLGMPIIYRATIRSLDNRTLKGKVYNLDSGKEAYIHFQSTEDFLKLHPFLARKEEQVQFFGCPIIEYGAFDPNAGDIYFLDLYS
ncbi:hypothetical protein IFO70_33285 [Phormidium tenue FACHB-886]|nr:hypothetical protein [Phormidium tenue FACHB-886]